MRIELELSDLFYMLSPVGCVVEAVMTALLFIAMIGCAVGVVI